MGLQNLECALARESNVELVLFFCELAFFILPFTHLISKFIGSSSTSNFTLFINALSYLSLVLSILLLGRMAKNNTYGQGYCPANHL